MHTGFIFGVILIYFIVLFVISLLTGKSTSNDTFFRAGKKSPWLVVSFGMIGASLSGVTFISIPGVVGAQGLNSQYAYMQMVAGYTCGYFVIAYLLLPLYYRLNLTSIYSYLRERFGPITNKVSALFFMISRGLGASIRLYLVVIVLQYFLMDRLNISFYTTSALTIMLIWIYTFRGGLKTVVWTDTLQTAFMLGSVVLTIIYICKELHLGITDIIPAIQKQDLGKVFFFENGWSNVNYFWKHFLAGIFTTIAMTGLDQDMMQKNLSCKNLKDAQKNMISLGLTLIPINLLFITLGALMYVYADLIGIQVPTMEVQGELVPRYDLLFPYLAIEQWGGYIGIIFLLGLIAAAYSSADSTLTSLTTSFSIDFMGIDRKKNGPNFRKKRTLIHLAFSIILFTFIAAFKLYSEESVINSVFKIAGYTYGPLLGFFAFGQLTKRKIIDWHALPIAILSPISSYYLAQVLKSSLQYETGFELLIFNGLICIFFMYLSSLIFSLCENKS